MYKNYPVIKESIKSDLIQMRDEIKKISNFINVYAPSTDPDNIACALALEWLALYQRNHIQNA